MTAKWEPIPDTGYPDQQADIAGAAMTRLRAALDGQEQETGQ